MVGAAFLFTDIEGSTRLLNQLGEGYADVLATHHRYLREAAHDAGGEEIGTSGDAFYLAFPDARSALNAAIRAQHLLAANPWPTGAVVKVRMGLHVGIASHTEAGWVGLGLHEVARVSDAAHGGQIIVSEAAVRELRSMDLPTEVEFLDLGIHQLKDLARQRLFQVVAEGLDRSFPPPRAIRDRRHNLPASVTSFVGRAKEKQELAELISRRRLVTLIGPGGVGKTRLTMEVAAELLQTHADGAWLVDLAAIGEQALIPDGIIRALGLMPDPDVDPMDAAAAWVADREVIVVLDNCEHLLEGAAAAADRLASAGSGVRVIATSQAPLGVLGEARYPMAPLNMAPDKQGAELPAASHLFLERAGLIEPGLPVDREALDAIERICERVEGLPLAIEMAAAWVDYLDLPTIADRVERRFDLLTKGSSTAPERHRSLLAMVTWSYELLDSREQSALRRLAVLSGEFDTAMAESVLSDEAGPIDEVLRTLVERSLVQAVNRAGHRRFRLADTIQEFAGGVVGREQERAHALRGLLDHLIGRADLFVSQIFGTAEVAEMGRLLEDLPNIRVALGWALDNDPVAGLYLAVNLQMFWEVKGLAAEGRRWLEDLLRLGTDASEALLIEAYIIIGVLANAVGERATARDWHQRAIDRAEDAGLGELRLRAMGCMGAALMNDGRDAEAVGVFNQALADARAAGGPTWLIGRMLNDLGIACARAGDLQTARAHMEESLEIRFATGDETALGSGNLGWLLGELGETEAALSHLRSGLRGLIDHANRSYAPLAAIEDIGRVLYRAGLPRRGATLIEFSRRVGPEIGSTSMDAPALAKVLDQAREVIGSEGWKEVEALAGSLQMDDAVALALDESMEYDLPTASAAPGDPIASPSE